MTFQSGTDMSLFSERRDLPNSPRPRNDRRHRRDFETEDVMSWVVIPLDAKRPITKGRIRKARFLVDESLGEEAALLLRNLGWNAVFVTDLNLQSKDDRTVFSAAWKTRRVLFTHDRDFLDNRRFPHHRNPGVVVFVVGASGGDDDRLLRAVFLAQAYIRVWGPDYMRGTKVVFSDDERFSIERKEEGGTLKTRRFWAPKRGELFEWEGL